MWNHMSNKGRLAAEGACPALVKRIIRYHTASEGEEEVIQCVEMCCAALASMLLDKSSHVKIIDIGGVDEMARIARRVSTPRVLAAVAMVLVAMVPSPDDILRLHDECSIIPVERAKVLPVLKKIRVVGFGHLPSPPEWLEKAVVYMNMTDEALKLQSPWYKDEFVSNMVFYEEFTTDLVPEATLLEDRDLRGFLFSLY